jgi:rhodanese-related sulfurtransferase
MSLSRFTLLFSLLVVFSLPVVAEDAGWRAPLSVEGATTISAEQAKQLHEQGVAFIDLRNPRLHKRRHIPGAHHLNLKTDFNEAALAAVVGKEEPVVMYCSGVKCSRSYRATEQALGWGFSKVYYFRGGIVDWRDAGYPTGKVE